MDAVVFASARARSSADASERVERAVAVVAGLAILIGIALRFVNLNAPLFWQDEAYTALRTTGHSEAVYRRLFDGRIHSVREVRAFETLERGRGVGAAVEVLAREDPHHAPLFYVLDRLWIGAFGTTAAGFRGLSALLGAVGIWLAFVLGRMLIGSRRGGLLCAALLALSPIFVLYSRQAREYALFADAAMLATIAFVAASRRSSFRGWVTYAVTVALGLYSDPIFLLVALGHAIAAPLLGPPRGARLRAAALAIAAGLAAFIPWGLNALHRAANIDAQMDWARTAYPPKFLAIKWAFNLAALAFDGEFAHLWLAPLAALALVVIALGFALAVRRAPSAFWAVVAPLGLVTFVVFVGRDFLLGSHYETIPRYLTPFWLACILTLACALDAGLARTSTRAVAGVAGLGLLALGMAAGFIRGSSPNWWDNNDQIAFQDVAARIGRVHHPLVLSEGHWHVPLVLAPYLPDDTQFLLFSDTPPPIAPNRNVFLVAPTAAVLHAVVTATRGSYVVSNVSPASRSPIASFHSGLYNAAPAIERGDAAAMTPSNALYLLGKQ